MNQTTYTDRDERLRIDTDTKKGTRLGEEERKSSYKLTSSYSKGKTLAHS